MQELPKNVDDSMRNREWGAQLLFQATIFSYFKIQKMILMKTNPKQPLKGIKQ